MIEIFINIIKNLWSAFFPKKHKPIDPRFLPPVHFNCRCDSMPLLECTHHNNGRCALLFDATTNEHCICDGKDYSCVGFREIEID